MALFGDSPRFHEERHHCNLSSSFLKGQTPSHIGPGSTYNMEAEDVRSGWKPSRSPKRQPMDSLSNRGDKRGDTYVNATLTKDGHILHKDGKKQTFPPTGQYDPIKGFGSQSKASGQGQQGSPRSQPGEETYMGSSSPRLQDVHLRGGVIITSSPRELRRQSSLGPGSYFVSSGPDGTAEPSHLLKKSHNRRASGGNSKGQSSPGAFKSTGRSRSAGPSRPKSADSSGAGSYFKQYTSHTLRNPPSPILQSPTQRYAQHNYSYSGDRGKSPRANGGSAPSTPYAVSPKRGIPIGRVYD